MSASRHISPDQLSMFLPASTLADPKRFYPADIEMHEGHPDPLAALKREKIEGSEIGSEHDTYDVPSGYAPVPTNFISHRESLRRQGVEVPIHLSPPGEHVPDRPSIHEGHHRVYTAEDLYLEDLAESQERGEEPRPEREVPVLWGVPYEHPHDPEGVVWGRK